jgi:hypothetical protein
MTVRIQIPRDFTEDEIAVTANIFFWHFANDLGAFINKFMTERDGASWLQNLKVNEEAYKGFNIKDPAALLKDLAKFGGSKLRPAIHSKVERGFLMEYYKDVDALLGERNIWYHRQVQETKEELLDLIATILRAAKPLGLRVVEDCLAIQNAIINGPTENVVSLPIENVAITAEPIFSEPVPLTTKDGNSSPIPETSSAEAYLIADIIDIAASETSQIGEEVSDQLLSHSYVLHVNGDIRNRLTDQLLSDVNPQSAKALGSFLLARKPAGGRIRITEEGVLCAFFGEKWGYLAKVKPEDWFPDHLHIQPESKSRSGK